MVNYDTGSKQWAPVALRNERKKDEKRDEKRIGEGSRGGVAFSARPVVNFFFRASSRKRRTTTDDAAKPGRALPRGGDEETEVSGIFVITGRGKAIQWRVARKLLGSICEINEFHNALTTFTVKTKSRLRGVNWDRVGRCVRRTSGERRGGG